MKILVTGAAGFIGSALCHKLVGFGHDLLAIDNFSTYYDVSFKMARVNELLNPIKIDVMDLDISDDKKVNSLITESKFNVVINLAAQANAKVVVTADPAECSFQFNPTGTKKRSGSGQSDHGR